jgi:hypothetical protein
MRSAARASSSRVPASCFSTRTRIWLREMSWRLASPCRVSPPSYSCATWRSNSTLWDPCFAMGLHPSEARHPGQIAVARPSGPRGPLQPSAHCAFALTPSKISHGSCPNSHDGSCMPNFMTLPFDVSRCLRAVGPARRLDPELPRPPEAARRGVCRSKAARFPPPPDGHDQHRGSAGPPVDVRPWASATKRC